MKDFYRFPYRMTTALWSAGKAERRKISFASITKHRSGMTVKYTLFSIHYSTMYMIKKNSVSFTETQSYVLNFHGRVTQASVKNFQIVPDNDGRIFSTLFSVKMWTFYHYHYHYHHYHYHFFAYDFYISVEFFSIFHSDIFFMLKFFSIFHVDIFSWWHFFHVGIFFRFFMLKSFFMLKYFNFHVEIFFMLKFFSIFHVDIFFHDEIFFSFFSSFFFLHPMFIFVCVFMLKFGMCSPYLCSGIRRDASLAEWRRTFSPWTTPTPCAPSRRSPLRSVVLMENLPVNDNNK